MENLNFNKKIKPEAANDNLENAEKKLERLEASLQKSFQESQSKGGVAGPEVDDLKTQWLDCALENPDMLTVILKRTENNNDPFQKQLHALASEGVDILKTRSMIAS